MIVLMSAKGTNNILGIKIGKIMKKSLFEFEFIN
jgi:hypothetical protein